MANKTTNEVIREKIEFIDNNGHILNNILFYKMESNATVLEAVTEVIISNKPLVECHYYEQLVDIIDENRIFYGDRKGNFSQSFGVIFNVANYINQSIEDQDLKEEIRNRLRKYSSSFQGSGIPSRELRNYICFDSPKVMVKK